MSLTDRLGRPLRNLRLSVTDRCNLRCEYCMPETDYVWLPREDVLHFEEISALVDVFISHGVTKVRLTGGEPLLRRDLATLVRLLAAKPGLEDLALTTNGTLLREQARELKEAGLGRLTVSLDTLRPDRFKTLTRFDELARVQDGIDAAREIFGRAGDPHPSGEAESLRSRPSDVNALPASGTRAPNPAREAESLRSRPSNVNALPASGTRAPNPAREAESLRSRPSNVNALPASGGGAPRGVKIDTVVIRGVNDDELIDLLEYARAMRAELRFIEYMDVGGATRWTAERVVPRSEMLEILTRQYGTIEPIAETTSAPAERFALPDGTTFGIIASTTEPFCRSCDRSRLTADGLWFLCLYGTRGIDLRGPLRQGASASEIGRLISAEWAGRVDRGAEERLALGERRAFVPITSLRRDPHLEMHTRGG